MTKYYVDENGNYLGGFDGSNPPENSTEIDLPPSDGRMVLVNGQWELPVLIQSSNEREWRDKELERADIEVFKTEDTLGVFDAEPWRSYRLLLRAWPESPDFPDSSKRPVAPDAV